VEALAVIMVSGTNGKTSAYNQQNHRYAALA